MTKNRQILLASRPKGEPTRENFRLVESDIPQPPKNGVLLKTLYLSLDPYMRGRMSDAPSYAAADGDRRGHARRHGERGDRLGITSASRRATSLSATPAGRNTQSRAASGLRKVDPTLAPISTALGVLGMPGMTAYTGLLNIGKPKPGETLVVAAASGAVGAIVGQIAKLKGCRVVGIAGGADKVRYIVDELGFDAGIDHRARDFADKLKAACPKGIDIYFENVGGKVWEAVFPLLNLFARVPVCGLIAQLQRRRACRQVPTRRRADALHPDQAPDLAGLHRHGFRLPRPMTSCAMSAPGSKPASSSTARTSWTDLRMRPMRLSACCKAGTSANC